MIDGVQVVPCVPPNAPLLSATLSPVSKQVAGVKPGHDSYTRKCTTVDVSRVAACKLPPRLGDASGFEGQECLHRASTWGSSRGGENKSNKHIV